MLCYFRLFFIKNNAKIVITRIDKVNPSVVLEIVSTIELITVEIKIEVLVSVITSISVQEPKLVEGSVIVVVIGIELKTLVIMVYNYCNPVQFNMMIFDYIS